MKKVFVVVALVVGVALYFWFSASSLQRQALDRTPPLVRIEQVDMSPISESIEALGTVRALESVQITARVTGKVKAVHFDDNSAVEAGGILLELDATRERAALREAQVVLKEDNRLLNHYQTLSSSQAVSRTMLEEQRSKVAGSEARVAIAEALLADFVIAAPFSGVLGVRQVSLGALVSPSTPITTLDAIATVKVDFTVPERWVSQLVEGQAIAGSSVAWPERAFVGTVASIGSRVDPATRAVHVYAEMDNAELLLRPGMLLGITLESQQRSALMVSEQAIIQEGSQRFVFIVNDENTVERRAIKLGLRLRGEVEVIDGLIEGEKIIVEGSQKVRQGSLVRIAPSSKAS